MPATIVMGGQWGDEGKGKLTDALAADADIVVRANGGANAANGFFIFIRSLADPLALFFPGLFPVSNPDLAVILNYGLAAVFWLVVSGIIARLVAR